MLIDNTIQTLSQTLGNKLLHSGDIVATAESCTGGGVAYAITEISGSSQWFDRSFITYTNEAKIDMLNVKQATLNENGAVSEAVVREMAMGAVANSKATIAVSISGIAGPGGGSPEKPVGTICFSWYQGSENSGRHKTEKHFFQGDRHSIRVQAIAVALKGLIAFLNY